jgi:hypothetical protein
VNAPLRLAATRTVRLHDTFSAWRQRDGGKASRLECGGAILADVLSEAQAQCQHKDVLFILHRDGLTGDKTLHCYAIRQGKPEWVRKPGFAHVVQVKPLKADPLFVLPVRQFDPVEPWSHTPGCDVVGMDRETVDG